MTTINLVQRGWEIFAMGIFGLVVSGAQIVTGKAMVPRRGGGTGKQIAHTLVERGGRARSDHIANVSGKILRPVVMKQVSRKSLVYDR